MIFKNSGFEDISLSNFFLQKIECCRGVCRSIKSLMGADLLVADEWRHKQDELKSPFDVWPQQKKTPTFF